MRKRLIIGASLVLAFASLIGLVQTQQTSAINVDNEDKITICHRHNSVTNPYNSESVSLSAVDGVGNSDHYGKHQGPIASSEAVAQALKDADTKWGDIIPPTEAQPTGLNWTAVGQAIYYNECNYVTTVTPADPTFTPPTCSATGSYAIPETTGVEYSIEGTVVAAGTYSAANGSSVTITATALKGYFIDGTSEWSYTFTVPTSCDDDGDVLGTTTTTPPTLPVTSGDMTIAGITLASIVAGLVTLLSLVARGVLGRQV